MTFDQKKGNFMLTDLKIVNLAVQVISNYNISTNFHFIRKYKFRCIQLKHI